MGKQLTVLVIDDSAFNRQTITAMLESDPSFKVIATASDGEQGLKLAATHKPDLITLDIEMPRMDGFTFLRMLMSQMPTPVIVVSSHSRKHEVFQALELGALDFVAKPSRFFEGEEETLRDELVSKALAVRLLQIVPFTHSAATARGGPESRESHSPTEDSPSSKPGILRRFVCVGSSTGGPPALQKLFEAQEANSDTAFLVAQHMPEKFTKAFAERLDRRSGMHIKEAEDGEKIKAGTAYIAAGGHHMEVVHLGTEYFIRQQPRSESDGYVPSVDRLFESAATSCGARTLGVILTGMGNDGAAGVKALSLAGGQIAAESQESSIVFGMPKEAIATGKVDKVLDLKDVIIHVAEFANA